MVSYLDAGFALVLLLVAGYLGRDLWSYVVQYRTLSGVEPDSPVTFEDGRTVTLRGQAIVEDTAAVDPGVSQFTDTDALGLLAWRVRERRRSGSRKRRRRRWKTVDSGLAVGQLSIDTPNGAVSVDIDSIQRLTASDDMDPWDSRGLHLGESDRVLDPADGSSADDGFSVDVTLGPLDVSGRAKLELNQIRTGDDVVVHGRLRETDDGWAIGDSEGPFVVASGTIGTVISELRAKLVKTALIVLVLLVFVGAILGGVADGVEFN